MSLCIDRLDFILMKMIEKIVCMKCQKKTPPLAWYEMVEDMIAKVEAMGGKASNPRYICADCAQALYWLHLAQFYCTLSTTS